MKPPSRALFEPFFITNATIGPPIASYGKIFFSVFCPVFQQLQARNAAMVQVLGKA